MTRTSFFFLAASVLLVFGGGSEADPLDGSVDGGMGASTTDAGEGGQPDGAPRRVRGRAGLRLE